MSGSCGTSRTSCSLLEGRNPAEEGNIAFLFPPSIQTLLAHDGAGLSPFPDRKQICPRGLGMLPPQLSHPKAPCGHACPIAGILELPASQQAALSLSKSQTSLGEGGKQQTKCKPLPAPWHVGSG